MHADTHRHTHTHTYTHPPTHTHTHTDTHTHTHTHTYVTLLCLGRSHSLILTHLGEGDNPGLLIHELSTYIHTYTRTYYIQICNHPPMTPIPRLRLLHTPHVTGGSVTSAYHGCRTGWLLVCAGLPPSPHPPPPSNDSHHHVILYSLRAHDLT